MVDNEDGFDMPNFAFEDPANPGSFTFLKEILDKWLKIEVQAATIYQAPEPESLAAPRASEPESFKDDYTSPISEVAVFEPVPGPDSETAISTRFESVDDSLLELSSPEDFQQVKGLADRIYEYFIPPALSPLEKAAIVRKEENLKNYNSKSESYYNIIAHNEKTDNLLIKNKVDICNDWSDSEKNYIKKAYRDQIQKLPNLDQTQYDPESWSRVGIEYGDSKFKGPAGLCNELKCYDGSSLGVSFDSPESKGDCERLKQQSKLAEFAISESEKNRKMLAEHLKELNDMSIKYSQIGRKADDLYTSNLFLQEQVEEQKHHKRHLRSQMDKLSQENTKLSQETAKLNQQNLDLAQENTKISRVSSKLKEASIELTEAKGVFENLSQQCDIEKNESLSEVKSLKNKLTKLEKRGNRSPNTGAYPPAPYCPPSEGPTVFSLRDFTGEGPWIDQAIRLAILSYRIYDKRSDFWFGKRPPVLTTRTLMALTVLFVQLTLFVVTIEILRYVILKPGSKKEPKINDSTQNSTNPNPETEKLPTRNLIAKARNARLDYLSRTRGGAQLSENPLETMLDPSFICIKQIQHTNQVTRILKDLKDKSNPSSDLTSKIQKIVSKMAQYLPKKQIRSQKNKSFVGYLLLGALTFGGRARIFEVKDSNLVELKPITPYIERIQPPLNIASLFEPDNPEVLGGRLEKIQEPNKKSKELSGSWRDKSRQVKRKPKAKLVRFSDLPRVTESDYIDTEAVNPSIGIPDQKIRIRVR